MLKPTTQPAGFDTMNATAAPPPMPLAMPAPMDTPSLAACLTVDDHGGIAFNNHCGAMTWNRACHLIANPSKRFVMRESHLGCFDNGASVAGSIPQHNKWPSHI
jgi:hypothetical protein